MARRSYSKERKALAFFGPGDSTPDNTIDLLNDFLGFPESLDEDETTLLFVHSGGKPSSGMESVLSWLDAHELIYDVLDLSGKAKTYHEFADEILPSTDDLSADVLGWLKEQDSEPYLIALWGEEGDADLAGLIKSAAASDVTVLDLTAGLDLLILEETEEVAPEPEPEEPKRGRGRPRKTPPKEETIETEEEEVTEDAPVEEPKKTRGRPRKTTEEAPATSDSSETSSRSQKTQSVAVTADVSGDFFELNNKFLEILGEVKSLSSREASLAATKLQEASFWLGQHYLVADQVEIKFESK